MKIEIVLHPDRMRPGTLKAFNDDEAPVLGPRPCLGRGGGEARNPTRSALWPFGDTPTGTWRIYQYVAPTSEGMNVRAYRRHGALDLWPAEGSDRVCEQTDHDQKGD